MAYRDDRDAMVARLEALERTASRVEILEERIRELEAENAALRAGVPAAPAPVEAPGDFEIGVGSIYVDDKVVRYAEAIAAATRAHDPRIVSGARDADAARVIELARQRAQVAGRRYVVPDDVKHAARAHL